MICPHCRASATTGHKHRIALGYPRFGCLASNRRFKKRIGMPTNDLQYPTGVVTLAVLWRLRYKMSFRDVAVRLLRSGFQLPHETMRAWKLQLTAPCGPTRGRRRGRAGVSWYPGETYVRVAGRSCYLYCAIDRDGELLDSMLSTHRDKHAARRFLRRLVEVAGASDDRCTSRLSKGDPLDPRAEGSAPT